MPVRPSAQRTTNRATANRGTANRGTANRGTTTRRTQGTRATRRGLQKKSSGSNSWMWWVGGIAVSILITLVISFANKSQDDSAVRKEMMEVVHEFPNYSENSQYYNDLVDTYHHQAFEAAYTMSGRRKAAKLDSKLYLEKISSLMANKASSDGKQEVAATLQLFNLYIKSQ